MAHLNEATGLWEDDAEGPAPMQMGALGAQVDTPHAMSTPPVPLPPASVDVTDVKPPAPLAAPPPATPIPTPPPAPAPAPDLPAVTPYAAPAMPVPARSGLVKPAELATLGAINQNETAQNTSAQQAGQVGTAKATATADAAARDEKERIRHQLEQQKLIDDSAKRVQQMEAAARQRYDEYRSMGIKDPEASQSFMHRLLGAVAIGLGEYSSKMNGGPNRAAELIKSANDQNIALQKAAIEKKLKEAEIAGGDVTQARAEAQTALRDLELKHAALLDASAAKLKTELGRMGIPEAQIAANQTVQQVQAAALDKREKVNDSMRKDEADLAKARIAANATLGAAGAQVNTAAQKLSSEIESAVAAGKPLTQSEQIARANSLGVPLEGKAGQVSLKTIVAESDARQAARSKSRGESEETVFRDEKGTPIARVASGRGGVVGFSSQDAAMGRSLEQLEKLRKQVAASPRPTSAAELNDRLATASSAIIGVAAISPLGKTEESTNLEAGSIGESAGHPLARIARQLVLGGNLKALDDKIAEVKAQRERLRKESLIPLREGEAERLQAGREEVPGGEAPAAAKPVAPSAPSASPRARASAIVNDPSKRSLYTADEWARLIKASRGQ